MPDHETATPPVQCHNHDDTPAPARRRGFVLVALLLAAVNLRPTITSLGSVLEEVRDGLGMGGTTAGLLTSLPTLCFALFGVAAPRLSRRLSPGAVVCVGMAAITLGLAFRPFAGSTSVFLAASAVALAGIAVSNVLMPVIVKRYFPDRVGPTTGLYSMALMLGAALGAATTVPMTRAMGDSWRLGLGAWAVVAAVAVLPWIAHLRDRAGGTAVGSATDERGQGTRMTRSPTAWALAVFFGSQAAGAYITMGWLPQIFRDAGVPAGTAGLLLAVVAALGVPLSFVLPVLAGRMRSQGALVVTLGLFGLAGYAGLWLAPAAAPWAWAVLVGIAQTTFPLALTMIGMRARSGVGVIRLSAFAQSMGYLIAVSGPLLVGALYQHSGGWTLPIAFMAALLVPQTVAGVLAGRDRYVDG